MSTTEVGIGGNREHKDTLFRKIFGIKEHKKYLLSLYNALNHSAYTNEEDLQLVTLDDVLFVSMKNDVAFLLDCEMHLYEHQSTINLNMPLRGFMYTAKLWQNWIKQNERNIYRKKLVKIPTPHYTVFYNGTEETEDRYELHLSDAFEKPQTDRKYEWTAEVYNINFGKNKELMERCKALREYAHFVQMVRIYYKECKNETEAIKKAMEEAIDQNYLNGYFKQEKEAVFMTTLWEVNRDIYENDLREEAREEGREEGRELGIAEGREVGRTEGKIEIIFAMYQSGMPITQIASIIKMDVKELEKIVTDR